MIFFLFFFFNKTKKFTFSCLTHTQSLNALRKKKLYIISLSKRHCLMLRRKKKKCFYLFRKNTGLFKGKNKKI